MVSGRKEEGRERVRALKDEEEEEEEEYCRQSVPTSRISKQHHKRCADVNS